MPRRYRIPLAGAALLALLAAFAAPARAQSDAAGPAQAVAYQINVGHDGFSGDTTIKPPLRSRWTHQFTGPVSYPLIAGSKVYVTVADVTNGTNLFALDQASGAIVWSQPIGDGFLWANAAYDDGHVFVLNLNGVLRQFDASTGAPGWSVQLTGQFQFDSPPTADQGVVYTGGAGVGGTLYAVSETDGSVLWTQPVGSGQHSSPALSATNVYVTYTCSLTFAFDRVTGQQRWISDRTCSSGGGGTTPVYHDGEVYARDPNKTLDANTGALLGTFQAFLAPAFAKRTGLFMSSGNPFTLRAIDGSKTLWTFTGDGRLVTAPIVVGDTAYVGSSTGMIYGLSVKSGQVVWSANVGAAIALPDEFNDAVLTGLGAGQGLLVVPAGNELAAYSD